MAEKPLWLKITQVVSIIGIILSIIGFILFIIPSFGGEWGAIVSLGLFLPMFFVFLGAWLIGIWINYLIKRNKTLANIISGIGIIASIISLILIIATPNWIFSAFVFLIGLDIIALAFFCFLLYVINRK